MSVLPSTRQGRLDYFNARTSLWLANFASIGISTAQATALKAAVGTNLADAAAMEVAHNAAKSATNTFYTSNNALVALGRDLIKTIKAYAQTTNNPMVYSLSNIDPPAPPSPVPAPDVPTDLVGSVTPDGVVTLSWKATQSGASSGIFFVIERKHADDADYNVVSATVEKSFMDPGANIPAGMVQYRIKAVRGSDESDWTTPVVFNFGVGGGMMDAQAGSDLKMAA